MTSETYKITTDLTHVEMQARLRQARLEQMRVLGGLFRALGNGIISLISRLPHLFAGKFGSGGTTTGSTA